MATNCSPTLLSVEDAPLPPPHGEQLEDTGSDSPASVRGGPSTQGCSLSSCSASTSAPVVLLLLGKVSTGTLTSWVIPCRVGLHRGYRSGLESQVHKCGILNLPRTNAKESSLSFFFCKVGAIITADTLGVAMKTKQACG